MAFDDIMRLNGKQTIYQMIQLADRIRERGGEPREPLWYKHEYLRRLDERIGERIEGLRSGRIRPDELLVHGARPLLEQLRGRGLDAIPGQRHRRAVRRSTRPSCWMSPAISVRESTERWTITRASPRRWSSTASCGTNAVPGQRLLAFGDGYVEIENTKRAGGLAVAVASDEANNGSGRSG